MSNPPLVAYVAEKKPKRLDRCEINILNKHADQLNREAADVLEYQAEW